MQVSQYIYTSWNNGESRNKGFTVYAKSDDLTTEEIKEILVTMAYKPYGSLPSAPSDEQIAKDFPKNYSFFRLNSGRYCMAQTTYVGREYVKDSNPKFGNYIIHAYVLHSLENFVSPNSLEYLASKK